MAGSATIQPLPLSGTAGTVEPRAGAPTSAPLRIPPGAWLVRQGEPRRCQFLLVNGLVRECAVSPDGREAVVDLLGPGDTFGNPMLEPAATGALALTACLVIPLLVGRLPAARPGLPGRDDPAAVLAPALAQRLRRSVQLTLELMWCDVPTRVERRLADLAARHGRPVEDGMLLDLPLTQEDLAALAGTTRESANRAVRTLMAQGRLRRLERRYVVPCP